MGHIRLGTIPKSKPWRAVVSAVVDTAGSGSSSAPMTESEGQASSTSAYERTISLAASRTLEASDAGLNRATTDEGLRYTFYLLTQVALASRNASWQEALQSSGIALRPDSTVFSLASAFQNAVDDRLAPSGSATDISEIAQRAAGEALCGLAGPRAETLFGNTGEELRHAVRQLSTKVGFGQLGQAFFGHFLTHYINFYLSRVTAAELGTTHLQSLGSISRFNDALAQHCQQSAAIVKDFAGEWYSKTEYEGGIDQERAGNFVVVAIRKLQAELRSQKIEL